MESDGNCGRIALITGAMSGLGPAYTEYFAKLGYSLILTGKEKKGICSFAQETESTYHVSATGLFSDLSDRRGLALLYRQIDFLKVDVLINNAADEDGEKYGWVDSAEAKRLMALQMNTVVSLTLSVLRRMINRNDGTIVIVSPDGASRGSVGNEMQMSSRIFIRQFTEGLSAQLTDTGIKVQAVCPGTIGSMMAMIGSKQERKMRVKRILNGSDPREIVECAMKEMERGKPVYAYPYRRGLFIKRSEYFAG